MNDPVSSRSRLLKCHRGLFCPVQGQARTCRHRELLITAISRCKARSTVPSRTSGQAHLRKAARRRYLRNTSCSHIVVRRTVASTRPVYRFAASFARPAAASRVQVRRQSLLARQVQLCIAESARELGLVEPQVPVEIGDASALQGSGTTSETRAKHRKDSPPIRYSSPSDCRRSAARLYFLHCLLFSMTWCRAQSAMAKVAKAAGAPALGLAGVGVAAVTAVSLGAALYAGVKWYKRRENKVRQILVCPACL